jgi:hypothetical protein
MALALFSSDVSGHVASHVSSSGAANGAVHGSTGTGAASAAAAGSATAVSPWHTSGVGTASYARYVVYIHILVLVHAALFLAITAAIMHLFMFKS